MKKVPIVINCQQLEIDTTPCKSWVLQKLDHECYLEKLLNTVEDCGYFSETVLVVPKGDEYCKYRAYERKGVRIFEGCTTDFHILPKDILKTWNIDIAMHEYIPAWTYQICKTLEVEFVYTMDVYTLMPSERAIEEIISGAWSDLGNYYTIQGLNRIQAHIFPVEYLEKHYFHETYLNRFKSLEYGTLKKPVKIKDPLLTMTGFCSTKWVSFLKKEKFKLIKSFFEKNNGEFKITEEYQIEFYSYINQYHKEHLKTIILKIGKSVDIGALESLLKTSESIGRLSVKVNISHEFLDWKILLDTLQVFNLHYILCTKGQFYGIDLDQVLSVFDVIEFDLPDFHINRLCKLPQTGIDYEIVLKNFQNVCDKQASVGVPQVGVSCELPKDKSVELSIVQHWFDRMDFCYPISSFHVIGHESPKIQYIKYEKKEVFKFEGIDNKYELYVNMDEGSSDLSSVQTKLLTYLNH